VEFITDINSRCNLLIEVSIFHPSGPLPPQSRGREIPKWTEGGSYATIAGTKSTVFPGKHHDHITRHILTHILKRGSARPAAAHLQAVAVPAPPPAPWRLGRGVGGGPEGPAPEGSGLPPGGLPRLGLPPGAHPRPHGPCRAPPAVHTSVKGSHPKAKGLNEKGRGEWSPHTAFPPSSLFGRGQQARGSRGPTRKVLLRAAVPRPQLPEERAVHRMRPGEGPEAAHPLHPPTGATLPLALHGWTAWDEEGSPAFVTCTVTPPN